MYWAFMLQQADGVSDMHGAGYIQQIYVYTCIARVVLHVIQQKQITSWSSTLNILSDGEMVYTGSVALVPLKTICRCR